ncbi:A disintegrin and metalloproteinase with thrombospondin motifs 7 isoform X1 [Melanotaenia boesemani]|uniref:A disintegrin and metalloproteinase with thrombospondin motifs 7 isoform X1 n=1 Tax=Melanotaenia boesemani TaxID=1250792 RepID=UPI001C0583AD|nr:A disintegrin and metalloproteinase with thrombospondin motifs 7 isoform X1 [Melanotaenia boesemani]
MTRLGCALHASGQRLSHIHVFIAHLVVLTSCKTSMLPHETERLLQDPSQYEVVHPIRVDARGHFLSNFLSHQSRRVQRREASEELVDLNRVFYQFFHGGRILHFNLSLNPNLLAPGFLTERRYGGLDGAQIHRPGVSHCYYLGEVWDETTVKGSAAISTCNGLTGLFKLSDKEFFIQPLEKASHETSAPQPHAIYKRHASPPLWSPVIQPISGKQPLNGTCGNKDTTHSFKDVERQREQWEHRQERRRRRIHQRSVSKEKFVETLVVADPKMVDYHGSKTVESYVLAVMNIVAGLFRDASIGNAINIVVVRLILLEKDEDDLKITHHADNSLNSFCKWQKKLNMKGDEHPLHHDVAVLLTRKDICAAINMPCETLGLSHVAGMCQPHRSCSINEDTGLPMAFTVAHELGHNFGIQHDGNGNDCEPIGKRPFVMSPQLLYGTAVPRWSRCSRQYITRFLDRGWGWCLDDAPGKDRLSLTSTLPGVLYGAVHQCRLQYGSGSRLCNDMDNVCSTLWCTVGTTCHSKLDGAVDGTSCGEDKWCISGECVAVGYHPVSVHGNWASWSEWSACSRTCGAGVQSAERDCDNPVPKHRGKYCLGERRRYRICNTISCPHELHTFRDIQCSHFNTLPYKGKFYKWEAVISRVNPCELHCRPLNEHFSEKMRDAVTDGTPCYEGSKSKDMCISGICQKIGCDYVIDSSAVEDRCGVCNGNGSTCTTVRRTFEESEGLGYVDIGLIPEGAWDILIEEVAAAGNFLALRSDNPSKYFLNGGWTIQWNGEYKAAGTVFTYERTGHLENLTSPGPTMEPLWIQLLFQETNPGVRYEYTISQNISEDSNMPATVFFWKYGSWTECSVTCGAGVQRQVVHCVEKTTGIVEEHFCDPISRPDDNQTSCNKDPCPAVWWVGDWQKCSASCGSLGLAKRTVLCIQAVSTEEQKALEPSDCEHMPKPDSIFSCNTHILCPADWMTGSWSKCSLTCGSGVRHRNVTCSANTAVDCDPQKKPLIITPCHIQDCPQVVDNFGGIEWSGSGWSSKEVLNEIDPVPEVKPPSKYSTTRAQPKNDIVDGDFHYHNNIENIKQPQENHVQVDDFYYDYNFINFHEDLSDDFEGNEEDSEGSHLLSSPQESKPSRSVKDNRHMETTSASTASSPTVSNVYTLKTEESQSTKADNSKLRSVHLDSENLYDLLYDEYLLPVSTTPPVPSSSTQHSQTVKENKSHQEPENISTVPSLLFTTYREKWGQSKEETDNNYGDFSEGEKHTEGFTVTPPHTAPASTHQTVFTTVSAQEMGDDYISAGQEDIESLELLGTLTPETTNQVKTDVHLDENASEIPQIIIESTHFPFIFTVEDLDRDQINFDTVYNNLWDSDHDLSTTSPPSSEKPTPLPIPSLLISGNQEASDDSTSLTGTDIIPPTIPKGAIYPPPADFLTATIEQMPASPVNAETTGTDSTSQPSLFDLTDFDYNEIFIPAMMGSSITSHPGSTHKSLASTYNTPELNTIPAQHTGSPTPAVLLTHPPSQWPPTVPTSVQTSDSTQVGGAAYWISANWSSCSTSCGLGAVWRAVTCSTGSESDCDTTKRPAPARQCYLRPCSMWKAGEWTKCSKNCEGGIKLREVKCFDLRDQRTLRPFHCRAMSPRPQTQMPCNLQRCLHWYASSWGQCSEVCGGGEQQRIVTCPEDNRCDKDLQPSNVQSCNSQPCVQWLTGSWGQCSASCGGGVQHRLIKCVNTKTETGEEVDQAQCEHEPQPVSTQKCHLEECESTPPGTVCLRDRLTSRFCQTLRWRGLCHKPNVQQQCCKTCNNRYPSSNASHQ